jgi:hypothetical protein
MNSKKCLCCNIEKKLDEFNNSKQGKCGKTSYCKTCLSIKQKQRYLDNKSGYKEYARKYYSEHYDIYKQRNKIKNGDREYHKNWWLKNQNKRSNYNLKCKYGVTVEQKNKMMLLQNNKCYCCGNEFGEDFKNSCVDHNHKTNIVRKILCKRCNLALGMVNEDCNYIMKLYKYAKYCNELDNSKKLEKEGVNELPSN